MQKKIFSMLVILLAVCAAANAATVWNPAGNTVDGAIVPPAVGRWENTNNWTNGTPDPSDPVKEKAVLNVLNSAECIVDYSGATCRQIVSGDGGNTEQNTILRIVDGGTLTTTASWSTPGYNRTGTWIVEEGGLIDIQGHLWVGMGYDEDADFAAHGIIYMEGGRIVIKDAYDLGRDHPDAKGTVYINEGEILTRYLPDAADSAASVTDIRYGAFGTKNSYLDANSNLNQRIAAGTIVGFSGFGTLNVNRVADVVGTDDYTLVTANDPLAPSPAFKEEVYINDTLELSWTNLPTDPAGGDVYVDVWYGTDPDDPNSFEKIVTADPATGEGLNTTSITVDASAVGTYYWRVDSYLEGPDHVNDPNKTEIFLYKFTTTDDLAPKVEIITEPTLTWAGEPVTLTAIVTDTGTTPVHIKWTWPDDPNVTVTEPVIEEIEPGVYEVTATAISDSHQPNKTLTLTAYDDKNGIEKADSDTVLIDFADNPCQGARGGFKRLDLVNPADSDEDCVITLADFAVFAAEWLIMPTEAPYDDQSYQGRTSYELLAPIVR